jgi:hypothetical protein
VFLLRGHLEDGSPRFPTMAGATIPFLYGTVVSNIVIDMSQAHYANSGELTVRVEPRGDKYIWELRRDGHFQTVKFSAPLYQSEEAARASGNQARSLYLAHLAARRPRDNN